MSFTRDIADYPEGIVLAVDKPYRWTSADVIRKLKYAAIRHFAKKNLKVGHAGTLDPLATGVLLVCIGNACKRAQELQDHDKEYIARIRFGATTPSYDLEKEVDRRFPYERITREAVEAALPAFLGEQEQVAPLFSAKSVDGVRAYELARKLYKARLSGTSSVIPGSDRESQFDAAALQTLHRSRIVISELELLDFIPAGGDGYGVQGACPPPDEGRGRGRSGAKRNGVPPDSISVTVFPYKRGGYIGPGAAGGRYPYSLFQRHLYPRLCPRPGRGPGFRRPPFRPYPLPQRRLPHRRRPRHGPGLGPVAVGVVL